MSPGARAASFAASTLLLAGCARAPRDPVAECLTRTVAGGWRIVSAAWDRLGDD